METRVEKLEEYLRDRYEPIEILEMLELTMEDVIDLIYDWELWGKVAEIHAEEAPEDDSI